ncbi:MAG TPA: cytochrome c3 family protein [Bryobacteraceae bacterium]
MKGVVLIFLAGCALAAPSPDAGCAGCHKAEAQAQAKTPMASALEPVGDCEILRRHSELSFSDGTYSYRIVRQGDSSIYRVTDGKQTISVPLAWAFGLGAAGQTYVFERNGHWEESRVSYYRAMDGLDLTLGATSARPTTLEEAAGRPMTAKDSAECFSCHAGHATTAGRLDLSHLEAGVGCGRCHEEAQAHAKSLAAMRKLGGMNAEEMSTFCGQCHRTWEQIAAEGPFGIGNIRFQPYRLANSRCYDAEDRRIRCTACHDPHGRPVAYDMKCLACHGSTRSEGVKACSVGKADCASCHMPKLELPGSHHRFTDHQIRVVKAGEKYPN